MIAFDSNVLIYVLEDNPDFGQKAVDLLIQADSEGGVCSTLVITEVMYGTIDSLSKIKPLSSSNISVVGVDANIAELAGKLKLEHGLKNIDSIHLATAILSGAEVFVTNDLELASKNIPRIKISAL